MQPQIPEQIRYLVQPETIELLFYFVSRLRETRSSAEIVEAFATLPLHDGCDIIALRKCHFQEIPDGKQATPVLEPSIFWIRPGSQIEPWQDDLRIDEDSLAQIWILSGGPPVFVDNIAEFALFTDASRAFYIEQGIVSRCHLLMKGRGNCVGMISIMWKGAHKFSEAYRNTVEFFTWVMSPYLEAVLQEERINKLSAQLTEGQLGLLSLAHDLKQPLTTIMNSASLLERYFEHLNREQIAAKLQRISKTTAGMNDWVSSILLLAHAHTAEGIVLETVDIRNTLERALDAIDALTEKSDATLFADDSLGTAPAVYGFSVWVEHIWSNLISNACQYGGQPPIIKISAAISDSNYVRFSVHDNGLMIPPEKTKLLFRPFVRLEESVRKRPGSGIGLTIVKTLVEKMRGKVGVESNVHGSIFWFTLPTQLDGRIVGEPLKL